MADIRGDWDNSSQTFCLIADIVTHLVGVVEKEPSDFLVGQGLLVGPTEYFATTHVRKRVYEDEEQLGPSIRFSEDERPLGVEDGDGVAGVVPDRCAGVPEDTGVGICSRAGPERQALASILGEWAMVVFPVGTLAFAFGEFTVAFDIVPGHVGSVPIRPLISVLAVAGFVGLNLLGSRTTGAVETILVALKVGILVAFGILGPVYAFGSSDSGFEYGVSQLGGFGPLMAAAISFVAFQGWQLLYYDQESIEDPVDTIRKAVYISIPVAVSIYILVGMVTVNPVPQALTSHPHVALKHAASLMMQPYGLAHIGAVVLALSALFSTGSAINATLFSSAHFAKGMLSDDLLPDQIGRSDTDGIPEQTVLAIGAITGAFTWFGGLGAITSFASLSFILVFGAISYLSFRQRDHDEVNAVIPAVGTVGALAFFPLMMYNLYTREPHTFYMFLGIAIAVLAVELLYFERDIIEGEIEEFEPDAVDAITDN